LVGVDTVVVHPAEGTHVTVAGSPQAREYSPFDVTSHDFWSRPMSQQLYAMQGAALTRALQ
jgi:hypothetical protein